MRMVKHSPIPKIIKPFDEEVFLDLQQHVKEIRRIFDWPGIPYHDQEACPEDKFNRWFWHELPLMRVLHEKLTPHASKLANISLKPSYCFLSMYGSEGICPKHTDRPQCQFTIDLCIDSDGIWPIIIDKKPYELAPGEALFYSGTGQEHLRKSMKESSATFCNMGFFHFVPVDFMGALK